MKINIFKIFLVLFYILSTAVMFGQGTGSDDGDLEGNDPPAAPINSKLILLALVGVIFAIYTFKNQKKIS